MSSCETKNPAPPRDDRPIDCTKSTCPQERNFIIVYGDPGLNEHNLGRMPEFAARTHEREVRANEFPGIPQYKLGDKIIVAHIGTVSDLVSRLQAGNIVYLAYFGHSWNNGDRGALLIGQDPAPDTNLTNINGVNNTPVNVLPPSKFRSDGQIRLFGCRGAYDGNSIAEQLAAHLHLPVYGYSNSGGSLFTTDKTLGHGGRVVTKADHKAKIPNSPASLWLVPANGQPTFLLFGP